MTRRIKVGKTPRKVIPPASSAVVPGGAGSVLTTKGDVHTYSTTDIRLGVGSDDQVLTADSAQAAGVKWATAPGGYTISGAEIRLTSNQSINNTTWTTISWDAQEYDTDSYWEGVTNPTRITFGTAGKYVVIANVHFAGNATGTRLLRALRTNNTALELFEVSANADANAGINKRQNLVGIVDAATNDYITIQAYQSSGGALNISGASGADAETSRLFVYRIGGS